MTNADQAGVRSDGGLPFGNPDGARANITEVESGFVDFNGHPAYGALATRAEDATARIIVGKLGAGKTVYLRRLQNFQSRQESVFADHLQSTPPSTEAVVKVGQWFDERDRTEKWTLMWHRAVLRSVESASVISGRYDSASHVATPHGDGSMDQRRADQEVIAPQSKVRKSTMGHAAYWTPESLAGVDFFRA